MDGASGAICGARLPWLLRSTEIENHLPLSRSAKICGHIAQCFAASLSLRWLAATERLANNGCLVFNRRHRSRKRQVDIIPGLTANWPDHAQQAGLTSFVC